MEKTTNIFKINTMSTTHPIECWNVVWGVA